MNERERVYTFLLREIVELIIGDFNLSLLEEGDWENPYEISLAARRRKVKPKKIYRSVNIPAPVYQRYEELIVSLAKIGLVRLMLSKREPLPRSLQMKSLRKHDFINPLSREEYMNWLKRDIRKNEERKLEKENKLKS